MAASRAGRSAKTHVLTIEGTALVVDSPAMPAAAPPVLVQAERDEHLRRLWLNGKNPRTQRAYRAGVNGFLAFVRPKSLRYVTLGDVQAFKDSLVKTAAKRAGLAVDVSAHWLRHAHVSHALDRGAPAHLVQATVGPRQPGDLSRYAHARPNDSLSRYLPG